MRGILAAMVLLAAAGTAAAQDGAAARPAVDRNCTDDNGRDRCGREAQDRMRALYGIDSPEDLLARGVTMRRATFVDGYGNDVAAITFWREPGKAPMVEVRSPRSGERDEPQPLRATISGKTWDEVVSASVYFDRELAPEPRPGGENDTVPPPPSICLHSWVVVVDAVDAPRVNPSIVFGTGSIGAARDPQLPVEVTNTPASIRSDTEDACSAGLAMNYAFELAKIALGQLSECSSLDLDEFRNAPHLLGMCHQLRGDRLVAGEASVIPGKLWRAQRTGSELEMSWLFAGSGTERQKRYLAAIEGGSAWFKAPVGIDADHAVIDGGITWTADNGPPLEQADLRLNLLRVTGDFVIDTFEVSNRRPYQRP
jgi:hypothetical protein